MSVLPSPANPCIDLPDEDAGLVLKHRKIQPRSRPSMIVGLSPSTSTSITGQRTLPAPKT
jgi:hypothetical protein